MLKKIPFKKKYLLAIGAVLMLGISYRLAFSRTLEAWTLSQSLKSQLAQQSDVSYEPGYFQKQQANLSKILNLYQADSLALHNQLVNALSAIAQDENVKLLQLPMPEMVQNAPFYLQKIAFEGDYFKLEKVLYRLENNKPGFVRSIEISTTRKTNATDAHTTLVVLLETTGNQKK